MGLEFTLYDYRYTIELFWIPEVDLDFVDLFEDLAGIGFNISTEVFKIPAVIGFVEDEILFEVGEFDVNLGQADFHMNPYGCNGHKKGEQADGLGKWETEYFPFFHHNTALRAIEGYFDHFNKGDPTNDCFGLAGDPDSKSSVTCIG